MRVSRRALVIGLLLPVAARAQDGPTAPIAALNAALREAMRAGPDVPFAARVARLRPAVEQAFDLPAILAASVGPRFKGFPAEAQAALLEAFTVFTVATWARNFDADAGESFEILPQARALGDDRLVATRIVPKQGEATRLDYVMRPGPGGWKAVDILLNGTISRVAVQRSDFRSLVAGGDPAPLLASLRRRAEALAAGGAS
jgi:phospholipid transport system substrate-binding protein